MVKDNVIEKLEELIAQRDKGEITGDEFGTQVGQIVGKEAELIQRFDNQTKQIAYLCSAVAYCISLLRGLSNAQIEIHSKVIGGRKSKNFKIYSDSLKDAAEDDWVQMIRSVTDFRPNPDKVKEIFTEINEKLDLQLVFDPEYKYPFKDDSKASQNDLMDEFKEFLKYKVAKEANSQKSKK